jgi:hypothetical protein
MRCFGVRVGDSYIGQCFWSADFASLRNRGAATGPQLSADRSGLRFQLRRTRTTTDRWVFNCGIVDLWLGRMGTGRVLGCNGALSVASTVSRADYLQVTAA